MYTVNSYILTLKDFTSISYDTLMLNLSMPASVDFNSNVVVFQFNKFEWARDIQVYSVDVNSNEQTVWVKCRRNRYIDLRHLNKPVAVLEEYINIEIVAAA